MISDPGEDVIHILNWEKNDATFITTYSNQPERLIFLLDWFLLGKFFLQRGFNWGRILLPCANYSWLNNLGIELSRNYIQKLYQSGILMQWVVLDIMSQVYAIIVFNYGRWALHSYLVYLSCLSQNVIPVWNKWTWNDLTYFLRF